MTNSLMGSEKSADHAWDFLSSWFVIGWRFYRASWRPFQPLKPKKPAPSQGRRAGCERRSRCWPLRDARPSGRFPSRPWGRSSSPVGYGLGLGPLRWTTGSVVQRRCTEICECFGLCKRSTENMFRAIIRLFCDLQSARHPLFRQLAQVINPLKFFIECQRNNKEKP